jgi:hypothetical protein
MTITNANAVDYGFLVAFAEGMYVEGSTTPRPEPRIAAAGWDVVAHILARDAILPDAPRSPTGRKRLVAGPLVFFGFLARNHADPSRYAAAVRGTSGFAEWVIDAEFVPVPSPTVPGAMVEQGFSDIYRSMTLVGLDGKPIGTEAADGIAKMVGAGKVTVAGHSLGSALATYLSFDVVGLLGDKASACLFASPRPGDRTLAAAYDARVKTYRLVNYVLDVVPYVPFDAPPGIQYSTLPRAEILAPATAEAEVRFDIRCNHNLICYCAMLDFADTKARQDPLDAAAWACVVGPPTLSLNRELTLALALIASRADLAAQHVVDLLWAVLRAKGPHV